MFLSVSISLVFFCISVGYFSNLFSPLLAVAVTFDRSLLYSFFIIILYFTSRTAPLIFAMCENVAFCWYLRMFHNLFIFFLWLFSKIVEIAEDKANKYCLCLTTTNRHIASSKLNSCCMLKSMRTYATWLASGFLVRNDCVHKKKISSYERKKSSLYARIGNICTLRTISA